MQFGEISDYSDLTAGQYEGLVLKRERHYKWRSYWCVLYGRQLTFYEDQNKAHVAGRIELQPGSHCDKEKATIFPSPAELFHREYSNMKKYPLRLKTKKGTHMFTYEDVKERTRWQMAINNAAQVNANNVRLSWIPTPFSMVATTPMKLKQPRADTPSSSSTSPPSSPSDLPPSSDPVQTTNIAAKSRAKIKCEDTETLITLDKGSDVNYAYSNPYLETNPQEIVTSL